MGTSVACSIRCIFVICVPCCPCRFYGKSHPTPDLSTANLQYLSSHQALADIASFHDYIVGQYKLTDDNNWIAFGGSYSGALAAWLRIKYPHIVIGSVASSAPVQAELNFDQYFEVVGQSLAQSIQGKLQVYHFSLLIILFL